MMSQEDRKALQELSVEQRLVASNIELIRQRMELTQAFIRDQRTGLETLEELEKRSEDEEILIHVGGGILVKVRIADSNVVIRDIGSGVRVESSVGKAKEKAKEIIERLEKQYESLSQDLQKLTIRAADIDTQLKETLARVQKEMK